VYSIKLKQRVQQPAPAIFPLPTPAHLFLIKKNCLRFEIQIQEKERQTS
jgi:hypothetical protein